MIKPTAFYGTPTYALHLAQVAAEEGLDPRDFRLKIMFFSGEPGASIPGVRGKIEELYGARVFDCGSMAEMTPWMNVAGTAETSGMLCWQDIVYTEVCDPATMRRVPYGARGTPVYTNLERTSQPMIRLLSGDLSLWTNERKSLRPHLSAPAARDFRPDRRHVHDPRRERVSERDRRGVERAAALRRRTPHLDQPRGDDGRASAARRMRRRDLCRGRRRDNGGPDGGGAEAAKGSRPARRSWRSSSRIPSRARISRRAG